MHQDFCITWLYLQRANEPGKNLISLLLSTLMDQSPFLFSDECCPLLLNVSRRRNQKNIQNEEKNEENWCHSQSHKLDQWPWDLFPLVPPLTLYLAMCLWLPEKEGAAQNCHINLNSGLWGYLFEHYTCSLHSNKPAALTTTKK